MQIKDKLRSFLENQQKFIKEYENLVNEFESSNLVNENSSLKKEIAKYKELVEEIQTKYHDVVKENNSLKVALKEQILDEKLNILKISHQKIDLYFRNLKEDYTNSLLQLEQTSKEKVEKLRTIASQELTQSKDEFLRKLDELSNELQHKVHVEKARFEEGNQSAVNGINAEINRLKSEDIDEETIRRRIRQNDLEIKVGLSWINRIGIFLILVGVATALSYSYTTWFNNYMKGIFAFLLGGLFIAAGEWLSRKKQNVFATGLTAGGMGILYYATYISYFKLGIIDLNVGLLLSILVTLSSVILSIRYNSKTICSFSLIGGYLPFFSYVFDSGLTGGNIYISMGYLLILNLLIMIISLNRNWSVTNYISFILNVPTLIYLVSITPNTTASILYTVLTFAMYLFIVLAYPFRNKVGLSIPNVILLGLNTFLSCIIIYNLFSTAGLESLRGVLAVAFCVVYFGLAQFVEKNMREEIQTKILFYITSLTFAVLMVYFQFGIHWLAMGWLIESVLLIAYGYKYKFKQYEIGGWIILGLCLLAFYLVDFMVGVLAGNPDAIAFFDIKYLSITLGLTYILFTYLMGFKNDVLDKYSLRGKAITAFKYFTLVNFWIYASYTAVRMFNLYAADRNPFTEPYSPFYSTVLFSFVTFGVGYLISKISLLKDNFVKGFVIFLYILADIICIFITIFMPLYEQGNYYSYAASAVLLAYNVLAFFSIRDLLLTLISSTNWSLERYPLLMGIYLLGNITALFIVQYDLGDMNLLFSFTYLALAFAYIIFGFTKKYVNIRRLGLGLSIFATGKLFIFDLAYLRIEGKILAYFAFGAVMLGISFIYQKLRDAGTTYDKSAKL